MRDFPYPVTIRILNGYIEVGCPDFKIFKAKRRFDDIRTADEIGILVLEVIREAQAKTQEHQFKKTPIPSPSQPRGAIHPESALSEPLLYMREVQAILKVSDETIRRLCRKGHLNPVLTHGRHRRFKMSDIKAYLGTTKSHR